MYTAVHDDKFDSVLVLRHKDGGYTVESGTHDACLLLQAQRRCIRVVNVMSPSRQELVTGECATTSHSAAQSSMILLSSSVERPGTPS